LTHRAEKSVSFLKVQWWVLLQQKICWLLALFVRVNGNQIKPLKNALAAGESGMIDWACSSKTQQTAILYGMTGATLGTMQPKFVPSLCR